MAGWEERDLYEGAIKCKLPASFSEVKFRQVPDNQEVWLDEDTDRSFITEINEWQEGLQDDGTIKFFLTDLAEANGATEASVLTERRASPEELPGIDAGARCFVGKGQQNVAKFNETGVNTVQVHMCAIRLAEKKTDILIMLNDPVQIDPQSSSADRSVESGAEAMFMDVLRSFQIVNMGLFDEADEP